MAIRVTALTVWSDGSFRWGWPRGSAARRQPAVFTCVN